VSDVVGYAVAGAIALVGLALVALVFELRRGRIRRQRPPAGEIVGPTPKRLAPGHIDEATWMKDQKRQIIKKLRVDYPKLGGGALEDAAQQILDKARTTLARLT